VREAELEEMEKKWAAENARIMREHPQPAADPAFADADVPEAMAPISVEKPQIVSGDEPPAAANEGKASS